MRYHFKTREFGVSDQSIHFLRSGFNYKTVPFEEIDRVSIRRGHELDNWLIIFSLGLVLTIPGIYVSVNIVRRLFEDELSNAHARLALVLLIPVVGGYFIYNSLQRGMIMEIRLTNGKSERLPLRELTDQGRVDAFREFMRSRIGRAEPSSDR